VAAGDLRVVVARRVGLRRRVALLSDDAALKQALEANGCAVLADPESLEAIAAFTPDVVVAFDGFLRDGATALGSLTASAGGAELVLSFANAASAASLLAALEGEATPPGSSEREVRGWLASAGYRVTARDVVVMPHRPSRLSADTEAAVRQLLEQLNPDAGADRLLLVASRGVEASPPEREAGLVSVIVSAGEDTAALEGTVRSVLGQLVKPLELVVVSPLPEACLEALTAAAKGRAHVTLTLLGDAAADPLARTNVGLARARGQYVCCLEAGELLDRTHLQALVGRLREGTAAWALSAPAEDVGGRFFLRAWLDAGAVQRGRYVVDRERLGAFALTYAEGLPLAEAVLFCRLAAVFPPSFVSGPPTLDSPRRPASGRAELREVLRTRPLRLLAALDAELADPAPVDVRAEVEARLEARSPGAARVFARALDLVERVRDAADKARAAAKEELKR
jgi:hypothetical protein